jgi:glycosyltransferase involved in cell wall biosynthesis
LTALKSFIKSHPAAKHTIEVRFIGVMRSSHLKLIRKMELDDYIVTTGYVSHSESIRYLMESDVLWLTMNNNIRTLGKLYEYIGARKPIIISTPDGIMRKTALDTNAAIATEFDDTVAIQRAISEFYALWKNDKLPIPDEEYAKQFSRELITGDLVRELSMIAEI